MKVSELIEALSKLPQDFKVLVRDPEGEFCRALEPQVWHNVQTSERADDGRFVITLYEAAVFLP